MNLTGATVVVTGAASGIGRALALAAHGAGARNVVCVDLDGQGAGEVATRIGGTALTVDVADEAQVSEMVESIERDIGPIDLFCANAGILVIGGVEVDDEQWRRILDVNVMSHVHLARHLVPRMLERDGGTLLVTASAAGLLTQIGSAPYTDTKSAAVAFAEWLSITYGDLGLKVSVLCPQAVATPMLGAEEDGSVAGVDGVLDADEVAAAAMAGLAEGRFLILPHPEVAEYVRRKADDRDRWIAGMRRLQQRFGGGG